MEPQGVVQAGRLDALAVRRVGMGVERRAQQAEVGHIGQQGLVAAVVPPDLTCYPQPDMLHGLLGLRIQAIAGIDPAPLYGAHVGEGRQLWMRLRQLVQLHLL